MRLLIIAPAGEVSGVTLHTRPRRSKQWTSATAKLLGRTTYEVMLGPLAAGTDLVDYYVSAEGGKLVSPPEAPQGAYVVTVI